ncbi:MULTISPECIES: MFS transporter [unclassified Solwaraspora]|uniref:MFS transporter n=1 Tax=unclassified Solwaraspora TaxID=2627926 RepID=UPI00248B1A58|nr:MULTISPECIES: MFS transporter [unclassified Solwaraspora]WBB98909.1 MFS transporter [Solwaraspora sp. WMMA2059]WBC22538.1 MFS transporter [Solwaraspora sp. WMMA2080]WJK35408.1 MFS transporter [Solwaraspora sp. WMMA2065]
MAVSMLPLYAVSALGPYLAEDLGVSRAAVGVPVTVAFAVAAVVSLSAGRLVDAVGPRRGLLWLATVVAAALLAGSVTGSYPVLVAVVAVAGLGMALANPATNVLVATVVPAPRRGTAVGVKQSGVQLAAVICGLALPSVAAASGWRTALGLAGLLAVGLFAVVWWQVPRPPRRDTPAGPWWQWSRPPAEVAGLMGYSLLLGTGLSAVNTYLPLYGVQQLQLAGWSAGALLAVFGAAGVFGRLWWTRWADRLPVVTSALPLLSAAAAVSAALVLLAGQWTPLVWLGAIGVGMTATGANAVSMLAVVRRKAPAGHASALVSTGFFSGFVVGPTGFGLLADNGGYPLAWGAVAVVFAVAALAGLRLRSRTAAEPVPA